MSNSKIFLPSKKKLLIEQLTVVSTSRFLTSIQDENKPLYNAIEEIVTTIINTYEAILLERCGLDIEKLIANEQAANHRH